MMANVSGSVAQVGASKTASEAGSRDSRESASTIGQSTSTNSVSGAVRPASSTRSLTADSQTSGKTKSTVTGRAQSVSVVGSQVSLRLAEQDLTADHLLSSRSKQNTNAGSTLSRQRPKSAAGSQASSIAAGSKIGSHPSDSSPAASKTGSKVGLLHPRSVVSSASKEVQKGKKEDKSVEDTDCMNEATKKEDHASGDGMETGDTSTADEDFFAPTEERVQTIDFSRIRTQNIPVTKNERKKKANMLQSLKKQVKNFFHEDRAGQLTDEHGNVELPMDPYVQARDDHDSGLLPSQRLFQLARHEQKQLSDRNVRNLQHLKPGHYHPSGESVDDYEFAWIVKRASQSVAGQSIAGDHRSRGARSVGGFDNRDGVALPSNTKGKGEEAGEAGQTTGNTFMSKVGSDTVDFKERIDAFVRPKNKDSEEKRAEEQREAEQEKVRKAQLLSLCGLVAVPSIDALSEEERKMYEDFLRERSQDATDGLEERYPCDCCGPKAAVGPDTSHRAATYYDLLFAHRKNNSFSVRFDLVHCLPRFLLHYKFHKQLYDCLDGSEKLDLVKAATDITLSYSIGNCTLQIPFGKYRTNAYPSFFAYIIVPDTTRYLEIFEVCNPPVKPGMRQKKNLCIVPNWPDKSYVTEFWTYSKESANPSDKDPRLATKLYEKNVLEKLKLGPLPELLVTRKDPPTELTSGKRKTHSRRGDFDLFEDFVLVPHHEQSMLGFGSVDHPKHATDARLAEPDIEFLNRLLQTMCAYVRKRVNTRQRRLAGREELSCTVNLSLHHSYAFKGHQRVYGFIGFPRASTYWAELAAEQQRIATLVKDEVTREDIRKERAVSRNTEGRAADPSIASSREDTVTETSADRTVIAVAQVEAVLDEQIEKIKSCRVQ